MTSYNIEVSYRTGDSFNSYDEVECVKSEDRKIISWQDLDIVKENLKRIEKHYLWANNDYSSYEYRYGDVLTDKQKKEYDKIKDFDKRHKFLKKIWYQNMPSFVRKDFGKNCKDDFKLKYYLYLLDDNKNKIRISCFWIGYFETLYGAKIIDDGTSGWSFKL